MHKLKALKKLFLPFKRIRAKLIFYYLVFMIVPMSLVVLFVFNVTTGLIKDEIARYVLGSLAQSNHNVDTIVSHISTQTTLLCTDSELGRILQNSSATPVQRLEADETVSAMIASYMVNIPSVESVFIVGYNGDCYRLAGSKNSLPGNFVFTGTDWYKKMKSLDKHSMLLPTHTQTNLITEGSPKNVITYITEISDPETKAVLGYVMVDIEKSVFETPLENVVMESDSQLLIIDSNKTILYHSSPEYISTQYRAAYITNMLTAKVGFFLNSEQGTQKFVAFSTSQATDWTIIYTVPTKVLYAKVNSLLHMMMYILILCIPVAIILAIVVSRGLTKPIFMLRDRMKLVEEGEFDIMIPVKSADEIGELSVSFNSMLARIKQLIQTVYKAELNRRSAELDALQAQINPHFLYNTLQIMDIMAEEKEAYEISEACQALSRIFRYSVRKDEEVSLKEEITHVKNYVYIQEMRFQNRLEVIYDIPTEAERLEIIKLIIQPLVENAIIHGIESSSKKCVVKIAASIYQDTLSIIVDDTGIGMHPDDLERLLIDINTEDSPSSDQKKPYGGIALKNINQRIKLRYGERCGLYIKSKKDKGTRAILTLPVKKYEA